MPYVIIAQADDETTVKYYNVGEWAGEWRTSLKNATEFKTLEEAAERLQGSEFTKPSTMSDGTIFPPSMIQSGANINNARPTGSVTIQIVEPETILHPISAPLTFQGSIDRTTKEQKINRIRKILEEGGVSDADLEMLHQNRRR